MKGLSLFSSAGIGETYLNKKNIDIIVANELLPKRAHLHEQIFPECKMICGDITDEKVYEQVIKAAKGIDFLIASPPCQGMSIAGKTRSKATFLNDPRNYLILHVIRAIMDLSPKYVVIENVPSLLKLELPYHGEKTNLLDILNDFFKDKYVVDAKVVNAADYGVPQTRTRAIIKMYPHGIKWPWPKKNDSYVTVRDAIGELPSLEAGEKSNIKWHFARPHTAEHIECMKHTATGQSAFDNEDYYPKKPDGSQVRGYNTTYRRMKWDEPAPTITIRNDAISSQCNVHPGRLLPDGTYSDARVLTPLELMLLDSLPKNWNIPDDTSEILIRQVIGESIPPLLIEKIVENIN